LALRLPPGSLPCACSSVAMVRSGLLLLSLRSVVMGQDATTMAETMLVGQAGKAAGVVAQQAEQAVEAKVSEVPQKCTGQNCCLASSCFGLPGLGCHASHGTTTCVGSNVLSMTAGMCRCVTGPCNEGGFCPDAPPIAGKSPGGGTIPAAVSTQPAVPASESLPQSAAPAGPAVASTPAVVSVASVAPAHSELTSVANAPGTSAIVVGARLAGVGACLAVLLGIGYVIRRRRADSEESDEESQQAPFMPAEKRLMQMYPGKLARQGH